MARIIPVFIPHEGCPHDCVFCNQRRIAAPASPDPEDIRDEVIKALSITGKGAEVAFYGGSFTAIPAEKQEAYLESVAGLDVKIRLSTRPDYIDVPTLERLKKYGVETIELGAQSMDDHVLNLSGRGHTAEHTVNASKLIKDYGFKLILQCMAGLPGDRDTLKSTAEKICQLKPDGVRIYPVVVIRDTVLYDMWQSGEYQPLTPEEGAEAAADMLEIFLENNINVIRIGLNPTEELSSGAAVAGAYHPALGEMTRAAIYRRNIIKAICGAEIKGHKLTVYCAKGRISSAVGVKKANIKAFLNMGAADVKVKEDAALKDYEVKAVLE